MKNAFESIYNQLAELKTRYKAAKAANDAEGMKQIRMESNTLDESIQAKGAEFASIYDMYESARERGNEHIDISECYEYRDIPALLASFRKFEISAFTFSSRWSSAVEAAWLFMQNGCTMNGMVEINSKNTTWNGDGYEKCPAFLFSV